MVLAKHYSRKRVLEAAKAAGIRPSQLGYAEINAAAIAYCEAHRDEMIAKAIETIQRSPKLQKLCEQERKREVLHNARAAEIIGLLACRYHVQNGGAKS
jgi:hypothetical protein